MEKARILYVSQAMVPYLQNSEIGRITRMLPQGILEGGKDIRVFMPKFGNVNERRYQLHEVIRLSGLNIVINDVDHPLLIKVASIQAARMQVYFIDNDDLFGGKYDVADSNGKEPDDNDERAIFFGRGAMETARRLGWRPDVIHCHGWFTSLAFLYRRLLFKDDPFFANTKMVMSFYKDGFEAQWDNKVRNKFWTEGIVKKELNKIQVTDYVSLSRMVIDFADGIIQGSETINPEILEYAKASGKPFLEYTPEDMIVETYNRFYDKLMSSAK